MTPEERYNQVAQRYSENPQNQGLGAQLRSLFAAEGPEAAGTFVQIPGADQSPGGRLNAIMSLADNLDFKNQDALEGYLGDIAERTMGYEGLSIPVEGLVPDEGGFFGGGGPFMSEGGQQFGFGENEISEMEKARRAIKDMAAPSRFDGVGNLIKQKTLADEAALIAPRELLGEEDAFKPSALDEIGELLTRLDAKPKDKEKPELKDAAPSPTETLEATLTGGRGDIVEKPGERAAYLEAQKNVDSEQMFVSAMQDFIDKARKSGPDKKERSIEDYKKDFADATGIKIDGKPDKSQALMAFGLALMQNKAGGKGITGMLGAIGEAGQAALPELANAKKEAKQDAALAGKYALEMQSADKAKREAAAEKAMNRQNYYIMPKGEGVLGLVSNLDKAKSSRLNVYELNSLVNDPEFDKNYEILSEKNYLDVAQKAMEAPEAAELYSSTKSDLNLMGPGADPMFTLKIFDINPNLSDDKTPAYGKLASGVKSADGVYRSLGNSLKDLNAAEQEMAGIIGLVKSDAATTQSVISNYFTQLGDKLGFDVEGDTPTAKIQFFLKELSVENASAILGESGKTLSDTDRKLVGEIVGELKAIGGDAPDRLVAKIKELKTKIIDKKRRQAMEAFRTLDGYTKADNSALWSDGDWSDADEDELKKLRKAQGGS